MAPTNPHAETYKGSTTFSGPIKSGSRWLDVPNYDRTTVPGTIAVKDLPNAGFVGCSQSAAVKQTTSGADVVDIVLPSYSMITSVQLIATVAWTGTDTYSVWLTNDSGGGGADQLTVYTSIPAVGVYNLAPDAVAAQVARWKNVNSDADITDGNSVAILVDSGSAGDGRGILTINYIPGLNL